MIAPATKDLERLVRGYVATGSGLATKLVRRQNSKGAAPNGLYATVLLAVSDSDGLGWTRPVAGDPTQSDQVESSTITFSAQWYRDGAVDAARRFRLWAGSPLGRIECERRGLTLISLGEITRIDSVISEEWEERAQMNFDIGIISTSREAPGVIERVTVEVCTDEAQADIPLDAND